MYTRKGCHLCDIAWEILTRAQNQYGFLIETQDVDSDPVLAEQFGQVVPVVLVNGKVRFRGRINDVLLERLLEAEYAKSNGRD
jgi:glutaredoxin